MNGNGDAKAEDDRVGEIKKAMALPHTDPKSYWNDPKMQEEYLRLTDAKARRPPAGAR